MQLAQRLSTAAAQTADQILLVQVTRDHEDEAFGRQAIAQARAPRAVPLVHKGLRTTVLFWGDPPPPRPLAARGPTGAAGAGGAANAGLTVQAVTRSSRASALPSG